MLAIRDHEELDELRETVRQLREALAPVRTYPSAWSLTPQQASLLSALAARKLGLVSREQLMVALHGTGSEVDPKLIDVLVSKMRKKLPSEVEIKTHWGSGFSLSASGRAALGRFVETDSEGESDMAGAYQLNIKLDDKVHARVAAAAKAANMTTAAYGRLLFEAAYVARYGETGDRDLDATVAGALILSGAELDSDQVARALKVSEATVGRIMQAWRELRAEAA